jgi:hypothetical protein
MMSDRHLPPDLSGKNTETTVTVKMSKKMAGAWLTLCEGRGHNHNAAIRLLVEREIRLAHNMPPDEMITDPKKRDKYRRLTT